MSHLEHLQALIDAILDLNEFYPDGMLSDFKQALTKANSEVARLTIENDFTDDEPLEELQ